MQKLKGSQPGLCVRLGTATVWTTRQGRSSLLGIPLVLLQAARSIQLQAAARNIMHRFLSLSMLSAPDALISLHSNAFE